MDDSTTSSVDSGHADSQPVFEQYLQELADVSIKLKAARLATLSGLNTEQKAELATVWPGISVERRREAVQELLDLEEDNVEFDFGAVFLEGLGDDDAEVRLGSVRGLWEHEGVDLIPRLLTLLREDKDAVVRAEAALALGRFVLRSEEGSLRERHFRAVESGLREVISNSDEIEEVRARALEAIGPHDVAWVRQAISEAYESGVRRLKVAAVHAMGRSCEPRWLPLLLRELSNEEAEVRYEAATALGSLGDESAVKNLVAALSDDDEEVRQASIAALGEIGGREAREALSELSREGSPAAKEAAVAALAEIDFEEDPLSFKHRF
jgi:HEAT repeat protein